MVDSFSAHATTYLFTDSFSFLVDNCFTSEWTVVHVPIAKLLLLGF